MSEGENVIVCDGDTENDRQEDEARVSISIQSRIKTEDDIGSSSA